MARKEIEIKAEEQMKTIKKQLEACAVQRAENQVLLTGLVPRLTTFEQRLLALPPPPDSTPVAAAHDTTSAGQALLVTARNRRSRTFPFYFVIAV